MNVNNIKVIPASLDNWNDLQKLFGPSGAFWNCWCMYWRYGAKEYDNTSKENKIIALQNLVESEEFIPGLLAYIDNIAVGWIGFSPRSSFTRLLKSRVIQQIDNKPVWSIVCFFIPKKNRGMGIAKALIEGAKSFVEENNIIGIEAYPVDNEGEIIDDNAGYMGMLNIFEDAGFLKIEKTKAKAANKPRYIMRYLK